MVYGAGIYSDAVYSQGADQDIALDSLASAEALGSLNISIEGVLDSLDSEEALGALEVELQVNLDALASEEALGSLGVGLGVALDALTSEEALGSIGVNLSIGLDGLASAEAFDAQAIIPAGPMPLDSLASEEALGSISVSLQVNLDGLASEEALGSLELDNSILLFGLESTEALGPISVGFSQFITLDALASQEALGSINLDDSNGVTVENGRFSPPRAEALNDGSESVVLRGPLGSLTDLSDDFEATAINVSKWSVSGQYSYQGSGDLVLQSLYPAVATVTSAWTATALFAEFEFEVRTDVPGTFDIQLDSTHRARIQVLGSRETQIQVGGVTRRAGSVNRMRLIWADGLVRWYLGDVFITSTVLGNVSKTVSFIATSSTPGKTFVARIRDFRRFPVVLFDGIPVTAFDFASSTLASCRVPATLRTGEITVSVDYGFGLIDLPEPFTYTQAALTRELTDRLLTYGAV